MKRAICLALTAVLCCACLPHAWAAGGTMYIRPMQTYDSRVKLRSSPSTERGDILCQYYAGTEVTVIERDAYYDGQTIANWSLVRIGGRQGYMMSEYLTSRQDTEPTYGEVLSLAGDSVPLTDLNRKQIGTVKPGVVQVLGTMDRDTLHVLAETEDGPKYGYLDARDVAWTGEHQLARIRAISSRDSIPVRDTPEANGSTLFSLYPGTQVYVLFSNYVARSGWTRIRVGDLTGYIMDPYLDYSINSFPFYRPAPAELKGESAQVTEGRSEWVNQGDLLFILGKSYGGEPRYYCQFGGWEDDGQTYQVSYGYVDADELHIRHSGGVSTTGRLMRKSPLYWIGKDGKMSQMTDSEGKQIEYPLGASFLISFSLTGELNREGGLLDGYLTQDSEWVLVEMRVPEQFRGVQGYLPVSAVLCEDQRLVLPGEVTGG